MRYLYEVKINMKKTTALLLFLCMALLAGCDSGDSIQSAAASISAPSDAPIATPVISPTAATATTAPWPSPTETTAKDEAKALLQAWADSHPFQLGSEIEPESDDHVVDGKEYYRFYLGIIRLGVAEILVDKETGELFHFTSPYATVGFAPIDEWYAKDHAGY